MSQAHSTLNDKLESILECLSMMSLPPSPPSLVPQPVTHHPHLKLEVPHFDGQDPLGWIFKISQFFDYQGVLEPERLIVVSFYMERLTLSWTSSMTVVRGLIPIPSPPSSLPLVPMSPTLPLAPPSTLPSLLHQPLISLSSDFPRKNWRSTATTAYATIVMNSGLVVISAILVGNDTTMDCNTSCPQIPVVIQGHRFVVDFFALPFSGTDIVLEVRWLRELGLVTIDYTRLTMTFATLGQPITLTADVPSQPSSVFAQQF